MEKNEKRPTMWVCRAGAESRYYDLFCQQSRIFMPWEGFDTPLDVLADMQSFRELIISERGQGAQTSISNLAGQLFYFAHSMEIDDYVIIPQYHSQAYTISVLTGGYEYNKDNDLHHSRDVRIIMRNIPRTVFSQSVIYSLGAYRTLFRVKQCGEVITTIKRWAKENGRG